jgi:hypothetical protein
VVINPRVGPDPTVTAPTITTMDVDAGHGNCPLLRPAGFYPHGHMLT